MVIENIHREHSNYRKKLESHWIQVIQSLTPDGLNLDLYTTTPVSSRTPTHWGYIISGLSVSCNYHHPKKILTAWMSPITIVSSYWHLSLSSPRYIGTSLLNNFDIVYGSTQRWHTLVSCCSLYRTSKYGLQLMSRTVVNQLGQQPENKLSKWNQMLI